MSASPRPVHVVTIAAVNYLGRVRVLARSFYEAHPDGVFIACFVDDMLGTVDPVLEGFEVIRIGELPMPITQFRAMSLFYDVTEFATALKPWVIDAARRRWPGSILYLDPDIEVFGSLLELDRLAQAHGLVLTPHVLCPIPRDGLLPAETTILLAGMYNLGFIGVGDIPGINDFLDFWKERLHTDAVSDPANGLFTDQRWIDFVPSLFPHHIHRDPGCNVAYWNLHERSLTRVGGSLFAGAAPLRFIHYSGFDPRRPYWLTRFAEPDPRVLLSEHPVMQEECLRYAAAVLAASDGVTTQYGWDLLPNGLRVDRRIRRLYWEAHKRAEAGTGPLPPDVTQPEGLATLMGWLLEDGVSGPLPRYAEGLFKDHPNVLHAFPEVRRSDYGGFLNWLVGSGARDYGISSRMVTSLDARLRPPPTPSTAMRRTALEVRGTAVPAVEIVGLFHAESGVGEAARSTAMALTEAGVKIRTTGWYSPCVHRQQADFDEGGDSSPSDIALLHTNADVLVHLVAEHPELMTPGRYRIGRWFWELSVFPPSLRDAFAYVDEVWVATRFQQRAIAAASPRPVLLMPAPLLPPPVAPGLRRPELGLPGGFVFLFVFDLLSVLERKNPDDLIEAYRAAFAEADGAHLVIKTINGSHRRQELERLRFISRDRPDIEIRDGYVSASELGALMAACDCYVSLHRAEGLGLTIAGAMALGKPTVATNYSGNVDFLDATNGYPIDYSLVRVGPNAAPYDPEAMWAQPDVDWAATVMRHIMANPEEASQKAQKAMRDLAERYSPSRCGRAMAERIAWIRREHA